MGTEALCQFWLMCCNRALKQFLAHAHTYTHTLSVSYTGRTIRPLGDASWGLRRTSDEVQSLHGPCLRTDNTPTNDKTCSISFMCYVIKIYVHRAQTANDLFFSPSLCRARSLRPPRSVNCSNKCPNLRLKRKNLAHGIHRPGDEDFISGNN